jgi:hypothetical protein
MTFTVAKWTINEYHQMIEAGLLENRRVELLRGEMLKCHRKEKPMLILVVEQGIT